jgi:hypothetical protein
VVVSVDEADNGCSSGTSFLVRCCDRSLFMPKLFTLSTWKIVLSLSSQRIKRLSLGSCRSLPLIYFHNRLTISGLDSYKKSRWCVSSWFRVTRTTYLHFIIHQCR